MENQVRPVEVTPKDIAMALDGISDWYGVSAAPF